MWHFCSLTLVYHILHKLSVKLIHSRFYMNLICNILRPFLFFGFNQVSLFRQFFGSVNKVDYLTLRHGFIMVSLTPMIIIVIRLFLGHRGYLKCKTKMWNFRHIWHLEMNQNLIFRSISIGHLKRISKLWWK